MRKYRLQQVLSDHVIFMEHKVNIMNLNIDIITMEELCNKIVDYLSSEYLNIILLVSTKTLDCCTEEFRQKIQLADILLPGEDTVLSLHHVDMLAIGGMIVNYRFLDKLLLWLSSHKQTAFFIARNEQEKQTLLSFAKQKYAQLTILGSYAGELELNRDAVINAINSEAPDILFFAVDTPIQEIFIMENATKINAKLCIGLGSIIDFILRDCKDVPTAIRVLHLEHLYRKFSGKVNVKKKLDIRIFRKKVENYKNKKVK